MLVPAIQETLDGTFSLIPDYTLYIFLYLYYLFVYYHGIIEAAIHL